MKKLLFFCFLLPFIISNSVCMAENKEYAATSAKIVAFYNNAQYDSIWQLFSSSSKVALPLEKTNAFFTGINTYYGKIQQTTFDHQRATIATYKLKMNAATMALNFSLDNEHKINSITITPFAASALPTMARNTTKMILPFKGEWTIYWGGDTKELNYHVDIPAQKNAFDIMITNEKGKTYKTDGKTNEDYYAYGQPIIAPCDGEVMQAVDGIKENIPGEKNPIFVPGNSVILKSNNNEFMLFAHFKPHSLQVKQGDKVKQGQVLGYCGNSGNSTEPHLHFHIQNVEDMNLAIGAKCYFDKIIVDGTTKTDYSPIKGEKVKNVE